MKLALAAVVITILMSPFGPAQAAAPKSNESVRPKVGLVLAGGGAKGAAHVGVIKVLEEIGVQIDYVRGHQHGGNRRRPLRFRHDRGESRAGREDDRLGRYL